MFGGNQSLDGSSIDGSLPQPPKQKESVALWRGGCYCKGGFFWAWSFMGGLPPLSLVDMLQMTGGGFCT